MKNIFKTAILSVLILLIFGTLTAQITNKYAFTQSSTIWEPVFGNYATDAMTDEGIAGPFNIGFTFPFGDQTYNQVKISSNGWVNPGANLNLPYYGNGLATINIRPLIAPLWDDLGMQNGGVMYEVYGTAPHRVFFVQWLAAHWKYNASNEYNFMARLHETGQVDLIYGPHIGTPLNADATIGMNIHPGGPGYYYSVLPGLPAVAFSNTEYNNLQVSLPSGMMYIFMPKTNLTDNPAAVNLTGPKLPMQNVSSDYTAVIGNAGTSQIVNDTATAYLMRGDEVLASASVPSILPGAFANVTLPWAPDTTGLMHLTVKVELINDPDSLNNITYPYEITAQPYVGNDDEIAPTLSLVMDCYPNPFRRELTIIMSNRKGTIDDISVYNLKGQLIRQWKEVQTNSLKWDGTDIHQQSAGSGVYLIKARQGNKIFTNKVLKY